MRASSLSRGSFGEFTDVGDDKLVLFAWGVDGLSMTMHLVSGRSRNDGSAQILSQNGYGVTWVTLQRGPHFKPKSRPEPP